MVKKVAADKNAKKGSLSRISHENRSSSASSLTRARLNDTSLRNTLSQSVADLTANSRNTQNMDSDRSDNDNDVPKSNSSLSKKKSKLNEEAWSYFTYGQHNTNTKKDSYKCSICKEDFWISKKSVTNLKSHLGRFHKMKKFLTKGQKLQSENRQVKRLEPRVSKKYRKLLHEKAVEAIIEDSCAYNVFNKPGMKKFIRFILPGYNPICRQRVAELLRHKYVAYIKNLKECLLKIEYISLTTDLWKNKKLEYFLTLTAHFLSSDYEYHSIILSFRKFQTNHSALKISEFIDAELVKLNIADKIVSITCDNEPAMANACSNLTNKNTKRFSCMCHNINLSIKNGMQLWVPLTREEKAAIDRNEEEMFMNEIENSVDQIEVDDDGSDAESESENDDNEEEALVDEAIDASMDEAAGEAVGEAVGETVGEAVSEAVGEAVSEAVGESDDEAVDEDDVEGDDDNGELQDEIEESEDETLISLRAIVAKARKLIAKVKFSNIINMHVVKRAKELQLKTASFITDFEVRWNTTFLMLERFHVMKLVVDEITSNPQVIQGLAAAQQAQLKKLNLNNDEWDSLLILKKHLHLFQRATLMLQGRKYQTIGISMAIEKILFCFYENLLYIPNDEEEEEEEEEEQPISERERAIATTIQSSLEKYLVTKISDAQKKTTLLAAYLDPSVFKYLTPDDLKVVETGLKTIYKEPSAAAKKKGAENQAQQTNDNNSKQDETLKLSMLDHFAATVGVKVSNTTTVKKSKKKTVTEEINYFRSIIVENSSLSFADFWRSNERYFPILSVVAKKTNIICATSCPAESAFSIAGYIQRKNRSRLSSRSLRYLILCKESDHINRVRDVLYK